MGEAATWRLAGIQACSIAVCFDQTEVHFEDQWEVGRQDLLVVLRLMAAVQGQTEVQGAVQVPVDRLGLDLVDFQVEEIHVVCGLVWSMVVLAVEWPCSAVGLSPSVAPPNASIAGLPARDHAGVPAGHGSLCPC